VNPIQLKTSVIWTLAEAVVTLTSSIATALLLARLIGPNAFGISNLAFLVGSLAETFVTVAFTEAIIRRPHFDAAVVDTAFTSMLATGGAAFLCLALLSPVLAYAYDTPILMPLIIVQGSICILTGLRGIPEAILARKLRFRALSIRGMAAKIAGAVITIALAVLGAQEWSLIIGNVVFAVVATGTVWMASARWPKIRFQVRHLWEILAFGRYTLVEAFFGSATPRLFVGLAGYFGGVAAAGELGIAFRVNDAIVWVVGSVTVRMALPVFSQLTRGPVAEMQASVLRGQQMAFLIAAPIFAGLALTSQYVVDILMGSAWSGAALPLTTVAVFSLFNFSVLMSAPAVKACGHPEKAAIVPFAGFIWVLAGMVLTAHFGLTWQLWVWVGFGLVYFSISIINLKSTLHIDVKSQLKSLAMSALCVAIMALAVKLTEIVLGGMPISLVVSALIVVGAVIYGAATFLLQNKLLRTVFAT
jgi:PST family polysaccharide transporter